MGEANRRKKLDPNFGKIPSSGKQLIYSTEALPDELATSIRDILKNYPEINENNWELVYQHLSLLVASSFLELSKFFASKKQLLNSLAKHYHQKYSKNPNRLADYPYYLISLFYKNINKLVFSEDEEIEAELDCLTHFEFLNEIIEQLLILMPRDIAKGVFYTFYLKEILLKYILIKAKKVRNLCSIMKLTLIPT